VDSQDIPIYDFIIKIEDISDGFLFFFFFFLFGVFESMYRIRYHTLPIEMGEFNCQILLIRRNEER